jgi:hypothetical protein
VNSSDSIKGLAKALVQAQGNMTTLRPDSTNNHLNSRYASLSAVNDACLPALNKAGIAVIQGAFTTTDEQGNTWVNTQVSFIHGDSGEIWTETLAMRPAKSDPQGIGSTITYGRKYLLMAMSGLAPDDDDGNASSNTTQEPQAKGRYPSPPVKKEGVANGAAPAPAKTFANVDDALLWAVEQKAFADKDAANTEYLKLRQEKQPKTAQGMWDVWFKAIEQLTKEKAA